MTFVSTIRLLLGVAMAAPQDLLTVLCSCHHQIFRASANMHLSVDQALSHPVFTHSRRSACTDSVLSLPQSVSSHRCATDSDIMDAYRVEYHRHNGPMIGPRALDLAPNVNHTSPARGEWPGLSGMGSPTKGPKKNVTFELELKPSQTTAQEGLQHAVQHQNALKARLPLRVGISPHDTTDSIITTLKNFYGLYAQGLSFVDGRDPQGSTLIPTYDNFDESMTVLVRVNPEANHNDSPTPRRSTRSFSPQHQWNGLDNVPVMRPYDAKITTQSQPSRPDLSHHPRVCLDLESRVTRQALQTAWKS